MDSIRPLAPTTVSVALISGDLTAHVETKPSGGRGTTTDLSMVILRYPDQGGAARAAAASGTRHPPIELVTRVDSNGRIHVQDPTHGVRAYARSDTISWGAFGLIFGAIAGATNGVGWLRLAETALGVGVVWGLFGLAAGSLYGLWAGRAVSARRLNGLQNLLIPGTSSVLAWFGSTPSPEDLAPLRQPGSRELVLRFVERDHGTAMA